MLCAFPPGMNLILPLLLFAYADKRKGFTHCTHAEELVFSCPRWRPQLHPYNNKSPASSGGTPSTHVHVD